MQRKKIENWNETVERAAKTFKTEFFFAKKPLKKQKKIYRKSG